MSAPGVDETTPQLTVLSTISRDRTAGHGATEKCQLDHLARLERMLVFRANSSPVSSDTDGEVSNVDVPFGNAGLAIGGGGGSGGPGGVGVHNR